MAYRMQATILSVSDEGIVETDRATLRVRDGMPAFTNTQLINKLQSLINASCVLTYLPLGRREGSCRHILNEVSPL